MIKFVGLIGVVSAAILTVGCAGEGEGDTARPTVTVVQVTPAVPYEGEALAEVEGAGVIRQGSAMSASGVPEIRASEAGTPPRIRGLTKPGRGLSAQATAPFSGAVQVRLDAPEPPSQGAVPVVVVRGAEDTVALEPGWWDPGASQVIYRASAAAEWWPAWLEPDEWLDRVGRVGDAGSELRLPALQNGDPPACRNDAPAWARSPAVQGASTVVCLQSSAANSGASLVELSLAPTRRTAQLVSVPPAPGTTVTGSTTLEAHRRLLSALAGGDPDTSTLLPASESMSIGLARPEQDATVEVRTYQSPQTVASNTVAALLGANLAPGATTAVMGAVAACYAEATGSAVGSFGATPDTPQPDAGTVEPVVRCVFEVLEDPDRVRDTLQQAASAVGAVDPTITDQAATALEALAPTAARIGVNLDEPGTLAGLLQTILTDASTRIGLELTGFAPPPVQLTSDGIGSVRMDGSGSETEVVGQLTAALGPPDQDSGWSEAPCLPGEGVDERTLRWGALTANLDRSAGEVTLSGWLLEGPAPDGSQLGSPIQVGMAWAQAQSNGAEWSGFYGTWETGDGYLGELEGAEGTDVPPASAQVKSVGAGANYLLGC